jgi:hypothetical protein
MIKLSPRHLKQIRDDLKGRTKENTPGCPYWTDYVAALLSHIDAQDAEISRLSKPSLPFSGGAL